jgi:predicted GH43/DUF377 family glycosyl hydrolase
MVNVKKHGVILTKTDLPFESDGVLNPAVYQDGNEIHIFYRALEAGNHSTIGYCKLDGPLTLAERSEKPALSPLLDYESQGVEDARLVKIHETYYLSYTAYNGHNALGVLATSKDLKKWKRRGIIVPQITYNEFGILALTNPYLAEKYVRFYVSKNSDKDKFTLLWDKNVVFFPRKINNKYCFFHRILPEMQLVMTETFAELTKEYWHNYFLHIEDYVALAPKYEHEISYIGGGAPPIETEEGWLVIYHGVHDVNHKHVYTACAALMDLENPVVELARLPYPLFKPDTDWELVGVVNNVVFPTGTALFDDTLYVYYGAADKCIACASLSLKELVAELVAHKTA